MEIKEIKPTEVFEKFYEIAQIPRESGNEKEISDYLVKFAKDRNLEVIQDDALNVIIKKKASAGYEDRKTVALQAHMDMVCVKEDDSDHNFETDPIKLIEEDGWVKADKTTLGADDGIGVAFILAILDDENVEHPNLEAIITVGEETSMVGANAIDLSVLDAKYLINIDSEEEGVLTIGCAGGLDLTASFEKELEEASGDFLKIDLQGFEGGHSGMEINKARVNAIKALARIIHNLDSFKIASISGGVKRNAIAAKASAIIQVDDKEKALEIINEQIEQILNESKDTDPNGSIKVTEEKFDGRVVTKERSKDIIDAIHVTADGMYKSFEGSIVTSSNIGVLEEDDKNIIYHVMIRSEVDSAKHNRADIAKTVIERFGGHTQVESEYSGWQREDSPLIDLANETWKEIHGNDMNILTTHGGLECGLFKKDIPHVEMISVGPEIVGAHSPFEKVNIESVRNNYKFLKELLVKIK